MKILRRGIAATVKIGAFVDSGDGDTEETALTISQADVRLSKNGGNMAQKNESTSCTHDELGIYDCPLDATDTNTLGILELFVHESGALSVRHDYLVAPSRIPGALFDTTIATFTSNLNLTLTDGSSDNQAYRNMYYVIIDQTNGQQISGAIRCTGYTGSTKTLTGASDPGAMTGVAGDHVVFFSELAVKPALQTSSYALNIASGVVEANAKQISDDQTAADNAEAFFDGTGYAGTNNVIPSVTTVTGNVNGNVAGSVGSVTGNVTGSVGSLAAQAKADVNAEVVDCLNVDTYAEPGQEAPAATNTLVKKIGYLFKFIRNKKTQDATTFKLFNDDAATVDHKSTVADDGTTFTNGELGSGP